MRTAHRWPQFGLPAMRRAHLILEKNGLHLEIVINRSLIGRPTTGIADVVLEGGADDDQDCETGCRRRRRGQGRRLPQRLGPMKGDLARNERAARPLPGSTRIGSWRDGKAGAAGRSLMLVRNVGHLMITRRSWADGSEIPEASGCRDTAIACMTSARTAAAPTAAPARSAEAEDAGPRKSPSRSTLHPVEPAWRPNTSRWV